jgi:hypothetical protein
VHVEVAVGLGVRPSVARHSSRAPLNRLRMQSAKSSDQPLVWARKA